MNEAEPFILIIDINAILNSAIRNERLDIFDTLCEDSHPSELPFPRSFITILELSAIEIRI